MSTSNIIAGSLSVSNNGSLGFKTITTLSNADATLTPAQVLGGFFTITPATTDKNLTLPTAALLAAAIPTTLVIGQSIEFTIQNNAANGAATAAILVVSAGIVDATVNVAQLTVEGWVAGGVAGSGTFLLVCTGVATPSFALFRKS